MTIIDSRTVFTDGTTTVLAHIEPDNTYLFDQLPELDENDPYDAALTKAWLQDQWHYVGIVVTVKVGDAVLGTNALWAIEHGFMPKVDDPSTLEWIDGLTGTHANDVIAQLVDEALAIAEANLAALAKVELPTADTVAAALTQSA